MTEKAHHIRGALYVLFGNVLYAAAVHWFLIPGGLVTGGTTGIALALEKLLGIRVALFVLLFNVAMLILGYLFLGKAFALTTIASTFLYPLALELFERIPLNAVLTEDPFLNTVFAGLGIGLSLGLVIRAGASTGGMDIPPLILQKYAGIPVSAGLYAFDFMILLLQAAVFPPERILYGIVLVIIYTVVLDKMLLLGASRTEVRVVSRHSEEIRKAILRDVDRGVTLLEARTGYLGEEAEVVMSIISNRELPKVERIVRSIDPESFLVVTRVNEVRGRGFTLNKKYR